MKKYDGIVRDRAGNSVVGAQVYIYTSGTSTPVTLYSDDGVTTTGNPLTTDNDGYFAAYTADNTLRVKIIIDGATQVDRSNIQHFDDQDNEVKALRSVTSAAGKGFMFTGPGTGATYDLTAAGLALLDDADAAAQRATLGLGTAATLASDTDTTLASNSDIKVATQKATKAYVDAAIAGGVVYASQSEVRAGTVGNKAVAPDTLHTAHAIITLTDGVTITWDMSTGFNAKVTLGGNRTLSISNPKEGLTYTLGVNQDATGSRTMTWPSSFDWGTTGAPTLTTTASKRDRITLYCTDATTPKFDAFLSGKGFS